MERVKTGINGLDELLHGGLVKGSSVLVSGPTGAGKTLFCSQFVWEGLQNGDNCLFITFEETPEDIKREAKLMGWDFENFAEEDKLSIRDEDPFGDNDEELFWLSDEIKERNIERVALDSTSILSLYHQDRYKIRKSLFKLVKTLKSTHTTSLLTTETPKEEKLSRFGVEQYVVDGVIRLYFMGVGEKGYRALQVRKMRKMNHNMETHSFDITENGIKVKDSLI